MGLLKEEENRRSSLEREIFGSEAKGAMGGNEVVNEDDVVKLAWPSAAIDILDDDDVEESRAKRRRRVVTPSALKDVPRKD